MFLIEGGFFLICLFLFMGVDGFSGLQQVGFRWVVPQSGKSNKGLGTPA